MSIYNIIIMCKYIITKGNDKNKNCKVKGQRKYNGYCKRHNDRVNKGNNNMDESIFSEPINNGHVQDVKNIRDIVHNDPFPPIIYKYKPELKPEPEPEPEPEYSNLYNKYKEGCDIRQEEPKDYDNFNDEEYLKEVANDLDAMHSPKFDEEFIKDSLFNLNLVAFSLVENGTTILKDKYPEKDITDLQGLTRDVYDEEELYKGVLYDIYKEHYEVIDEYISPITTYLMLSVKSIGVRYAKNKKKT